MLITIVSGSITNWLDRIVINTFVSEQICPRCGRKNEHIDRAHEICPECQVEVTEEYEDDDDFDEYSGEIPHQHGPMMYR